MVYKRYIKRDGKIFGPYYYESYRDPETGKPKNKIINYIEPKKRFNLLRIFFLIPLILLILAVGIIILNNNLGEKLSLIGFDVSDILEGTSENVGEQQGISEDAPPTSASLPLPPTQDTSSTLPPEIIENPPEIIEEPIDEPQTIEEIVPELQESTENSTEVISETLPEINQTEIITENNNQTNEIKPNITIETNNSAENLQINVTIQNISGQIPENISIINENISEIVILQENNFTINESTIQFSAKLGQPVKWKKTLKIDGENNKTLNSLEVTLPKTAGEVSVRKIFENESVEELKVNVKNEKIISETEPIISITGQSIKNEHKNNIFRFFRSFFSLVGRVIDIGENENAVLVNIQEKLEDNDKIEIEYYTEASYSEENVLSESHKIVNVVGSEEVHYENILAFSNLSKEVLSKNEIMFYWIKNNSAPEGASSGEVKASTDFVAYDSDSDGMLDYIEWIVPSLSNQTYEIILITKAQHLDSNRNFISDIYEEVKALDGNWSEQINDSEYVRVTFEKNLTKENDITIYPQTITGIPRIEVYESNKTELIAEFSSIIDNEYNKIYLTNLIGSQNTFDLKIVGGSVKFDYIVDPGPVNGVWMDLSGNDTGNWAGTSAVNGVAVNTNDNLVYTGLTSGKFGVYNHSNGVWMDLSGNDTGDWAGTDIVYGIAVNPNDNLVYTGLASGKFGVYNHSNGVWMNLSGNDTGNWVDIYSVRGVAVNPNDNLIYTSIDGGKFGVYNHSNGVWMDLSANDTGDWAGTSQIYSVAVNPNDNLVYTGLELSNFGVYNHSNGVWMNLSGNDTGDWAGITEILSVAVNPNDNLVYTLFTSEKFGVYNHSNGVWMDLSGNDTGDWVGLDQAYGVAVNTNDNLVYTVLDSGKFGVYNHSNGVWMDLSGNDTGNWVGVTALQSVAVNTNDNLVYTGLASGKFGVYNNSFNQDFGDITAPTISIVLPTNNSFTNNNLQDVNFTVSDTNLNTCWYGNDTYTANTTLANCNTNITTLIWSEGQHNVTVYVNDTSNNVNSSRITFTIDTTNPTISFANPTTNSSNLSQGSIFANLSFSDTNLGTANISLFNSEGYILNSTAGTTSTLFINFTGLADGRYYLNATVNDSANNKNYTETRTVNVNINLTAGIWKDLSTKDTGSWAGVDGVVSVAVNPNNNLVYTGLGSGKFGVYNHSNGIWMNLSGNDTGDWVGTAVVNGVAVNTNDNLVYTGLGSDKFGVYNHSNGIWMNLSGNDTGDWVGTDTINAVAVNTNNNLVYTGLTSGKFGVYNHSNGIWMNLSGNDTNNWVGIDDAIKGVAVNTNNNLVYTSLELGKFGVYNHSNGVWMDLSGNDTGNWAGVDPVVSVAVNTNNNLVYTGSVSGKFGAYNHSNGVWMDLSGNDTGDWVGLDYVYGVAVNTNNNLVYTGLQSGKFGVYNHSNGVWMDLSGNDSASGTGNWAETEIVYGISVNPNDNLVYTVLASGKFGAYNHSGSRAETSGPSDTSGGGDTPIDLLSGFNVAPQKMSVALKPNESKTECFTVANTGTTTVNANLNVLGEIITFVSLTDSVLQVPTGNSKSSCAIFSAGLLDIPKNYSGKIEVKGKSTKYIDVNLEIVNLTAINITAPGVLPVGILGFLPGDPVRVLPVGILGFLPSDPIRVLPVGIEGLLPRDRPPEIAETLVKGAIFISLWILLLLLLVIYLAVRKFIKLQNQLQGYKSREEKYEAVERLKRNLFRKNLNFFEKFVDRGAIYLSEKALHKNKKEQKTGSFLTNSPKRGRVEESKKLSLEVLSLELRERYDSGAWLYSKKDYENALKEFERCLEINNKFWQGWQGIGSCCLAQGRIGDAISAFEKSLKINPNNAKLVELLRKYKK